MSDNFAARYELEDGYVGRGRTQTFRISADEVEAEMTENELKRLFYERAEEHRDQNIGIAPLNYEDFLVWAKGIQAREKDQ